MKEDFRGLILQAQGVQNLGERVVATVAEAVIRDNDFTLAVKLDTPAPLTIPLPAPADLAVEAGSVRLRIRDAAGNASTYPITISATGTTINGAATYVISTDGGNLDFEWTGDASMGWVSYAQPPGTGSVADVLGSTNIDVTGGAVKTISLKGPISAALLANGSVSDAEFQTLDGINTGTTIQAQLDTKLATNGNASSLTNIPLSQGVGALAALANLPGAVVTKYTTPGTFSFTQNSGARLTFVATQAGGGPGGSGRQGTAALSSGGSAGSAGGFAFALFLASDITSPVSVTVGAGGVGGAAQASTSTNGNPGVSAGGASSFGAYLQVRGGNPGAGGSTSSVGSSTGGFGMFSSVAGGGGIINGTGQSLGSNANGFAPAGGGGGGGPTASAFSNGGAGGFCPVFALAGVAGGASAGQVGTDGTSMTAFPTGGLGGGGGASGDSGGTVAGGKGGKGGTPGGGGGGGGGSVNGAASGAGGNGGDGCVWVIEF